MRTFLSSMIATTLMEYFFLRFNSMSVFPTQSALTGSSTIETSLESSMISINPELKRFFARRMPDSLSGNTTRSAPTLFRIFRSKSVAHFAITVLTPISLQSMVAMTLAFRLLAIAIITTSILAMPSCLMTSASVISAHLQMGISVMAALTSSSSESTASTSAPLLTSSFATANPYLPRPNTA